LVALSLSGMKTIKYSAQSRIVLLLASLLVFAACGKKTSASSTEEPKAKETGPTTPPKTETPELVIPPQPTPPASINEPAPSPTPADPASKKALLPETSKAANLAPPPKVAIPAAPVIENNPKQLEDCLVNKVADLTVLLKAEDAVLTKDSLTWLVETTMKECKKNAELEPDVLAKFNKKLLEITTQVFPEAIELITKFVNPSSSAPTIPIPVETPTIVETIDYTYDSRTHSGSRDFRQNDGSVAYSISKIVNTITSTKGNLTSSDKNFFGNLASYAFDFTLKENKTYTVHYKDDAGELTLDYAFVQGSVDGLKKGDSARVVLTKESWLKVIEHETQKLLNTYYQNTPRSAMKILLSPLDPPTARTCNIGKGFFLGSHAIECSDPTYSVRIQRLDQRN